MGCRRTNSPAQSTVQVKDEAREVLAARAFVLVGKKDAEVDGEQGRCEVWAWRPTVADSAGAGKSHR